MLDLMIDPGHGGVDPGAVGPTGVKEKDIALKLALKVGSLLSDRGVKVGYTRKSDFAVALTKRAALANEAKAGCFLSIHINSASSAAATGTESYAFGPGIQGEALAKSVQSNLVTAIKLPNRGVKYASFAVLRETKMPAALAEVCFICNPKEEALLKDEAFLAQAATGIAKGVAAFLGIAWKDSVPAPAAEEIQGSKFIQRLRELNLITDNHDPDKQVSWAELAEVIVKVVLSGK